MRIKVKVVPGSSRDCLGEWMEDTLKIKVKAPPEKGRANQAVVRLLAARLQLPEREISVISGHTSPFKELALPDNLPAGEVLSKLGKA